MICNESYKILRAAERRADDIRTITLPYVAIFTSRTIVHRHRVDHLRDPTGIRIMMRPDTV